MQYVNRYAFILRPKGPMLDWIQSLPEGNAFSLAEIEQQDHNVYLIEESDKPEFINDYLRENFKDFFLEHLSEWHTDDAHFPEISYENFCNWFEVVESTAVIDLGKSKLLTEEI
ncbi:MAG: hypothetical protein JXR76_05015 [Deltaproteobacteria bacterium]|nr:hypothetical protein [Deltaproteobacteria bacterium]